MEHKVMFMWDALLLGCHEFNIAYCDHKEKCKFALQKDVGHLSAYDYPM